MTPEQAFELLVSDENLPEMNRVAEISDPLQQGYESAAMLSKVTNQQPAEMAWKMIRTCHMVDPKRSNDDVWRDLGVLKWCLEHWED